MPHPPGSFRQGKLESRADTANGVPKNNPETQSPVAKVDLLYILAMGFPLGHRTRKTGRVFRKDKRELLLQSF
jgi:hypothetical protein